MSKEILDDAERRMKSAVESTRKELANIRTGRANVGLLDHVMVSAYGRNCRNQTLPSPFRTPAESYTRSSRRLLGANERPYEERLNLTRTRRQCASA